MNFITEQQQQPMPQMPMEPMPPGQNIWDDKNTLEVLKHYAEDENIPKGVRERQWSVFGKAFVNTFMEERDMPMVDIFGELLKIGEMSSKPAHLVTFDEVNDMDKMSLHMFITAKRAIGTQQGKMNERSLQNTQISQNIHNGMEQQSRRKILGMF